MIKLNAQWTDDCQGKKDYDGDILSISTRYWPAGGGFSIFVPGKGFIENPSNCKPSANSSIILRYFEDEYVVLAEMEFEGETFSDVAKQVESWAQAQMDRAISALKTEFATLNELDQS